MYYLPPASSPLRSLFSVEDLAAMGPVIAGRVPLLGDAKRSAKRLMAANPAVRSVVSIAARFNDDVVLVRFGPRGGQKILWNFSRLGKGE
jgi:hypothetical protein